MEFSLEQPKGGVHFVVPPGSASDPQVCVNSRTLYISTMSFKGEFVQFESHIKFLKHRGTIMGFA